MSKPFGMKLFLITNYLRIIATQRYDVEALRAATCVMEILMASEQYEEAEHIV